MSRPVNNGRNGLPRSVIVTEGRNGVPAKVLVAKPPVSPPPPPKPAK
jgi:hypothetical protein